jgi:2-haloalkanoic acid dehalogenase type II
VDRLYEVITFDCYGTLIDWEAGIGAAFAGAARDAGVGLDLPAALRAYAELEPEVEGEAYRPYREVLDETARRVVERLGWQLPAGRGAFLSESLPHWQPFGDTNPALERLAATGYRLGILSNVDDDLLTATLRYFTVPFDFLITAQQVRSYKPAHGHFLAARERIGEQRWLHAAQSYFHDAIPARALGIDTAWINRMREGASDGGRATRELRSLTDLADWVVG